MPPKANPARVNAHFYAPYEAKEGRNREHHRPVEPAHGGYGVLADGYLNGPFFLYEAARRQAARMAGRGSTVVRWVDYVRQSSRDAGFQVRIAGLACPLTFPVYGLGHPAPIVWP